MTRSDELIEGYLDDTLTTEEARELREWLSASDANVEAFATALAREEQLRATVQAREAVPPAAAATPVVTTFPRASRARAALATATVFGLAAVAAFVWRSRDDADPAAPDDLRPVVSPTSLTLVNTRGEVRVRDERGEVVSAKAGDEFTTGAVIVDGFGAQADLADSAGGTYSLAGDSELELLGTRGKVFRLHRGALIADVPGEDATRPLIVRTPTAEATSAGMSFAMNSADAETLVQVRKGSAKVKRLSDAQIVTLAFNQQVRAGEDAEAPMLVEPAKPAPSTWTASPDANGSTTWLGTWKNGVLSAVPRPLYLRTTKKTVPHHHAGAQNVLPGLAKLGQNSAVRVKYRLKKPINIGLFVSTRDAEDMNFTGNFQAYIEERKTPAGKNGWRTATVRTSDLLMMRAAPIKFEPGCVAAMLYLTTYEDDAGLEIDTLQVIELEDEK